MRPRLHGIFIHSGCPGIIGQASSVRDGGASASMRCQSAVEASSNMHRGHMRCRTSLVPTRTRSMVAHSGQAGRPGVLAQPEGAPTAAATGSEAALVEVPAQ